jgi:hypothetical protein
LEELSADLGKFSRRQGNKRGVLSLGDGQVLHVKANQVEVELGPFLLGTVLKSQLQVVLLVNSLQGNAVVRVRQLHHLCK